MPNSRLSDPFYSRNVGLNKKERDNDLKLTIVSLDFVKRNIRISAIKSQTLIVFIFN